MRVGGRHRSLGSRELRGLGESLRNSGTGKYGAPSLGLPVAEDGGAGTQGPTRSVTPRSGVGGEGALSFSVVRDQVPPFSGELSLDWLSFLNVIRPRPGARPAACPPPGGCCSLRYTATACRPRSRSPTLSAQSSTWAPGPRRRAGDAPDA